MQVIDIRNRNLDRLLAGGKKAKTSSFDKRVADKFADAIAEAKISGDTEEVSRLTEAYATMMMGSDGLPEGFEAGDDL